MWRYDIRPKPKVAEGLAGITERVPNFGRRLSAWQNIPKYGFYI